MENSQLRILRIIEKLSKYQGKNTYINSLKKKLKEDPKSLDLTVNKMNYIELNYDFEPKLINKVISITPFIGEQYKNKFNLNFIPTKIAISFLIGRTDKQYHVLGKFFKEQNFVDVFIPINQVNENLLNNINEDFIVDFEKINEKNKLNRKLYKHQEEGVYFLLKNKKCILADDMGLMKSSTAIAGLIAGDFKKILILCPASLKLNWFNELNLFFDESEITIVNGINWKENKITIINYDILENFYALVDGRKKKLKQEALNKSELFNAKFDIVVCDEAHKLKNNSAKRTKIVQDFSKQLKLEYKWLLTGTPMANRPMDLFSLLKIIDHPLGNDWMYYTKRYCDSKKITRKIFDPKSGEFIKKTTRLTNGASNLDELKLRIKNIILRRKKDLLDDLPEKLICNIYHELTDEETIKYNSIWNEYVEKIESQGKIVNITEQLGDTIFLRQFVAKQMTTFTVDKLNDIIENTQSKVVVFCNFTDELFEIFRHFPNKAVLHYGEMNSNEKEKSVYEFQNNKNIRIFIGNTKSASEGITLTAGDITIFNSLPYEPYLLDQAESREHRKGQKKTVTIYRMLFKNTISEKILEILNNKTDIINKVI